MTPMKEERSQSSAISGMPITEEEHSDEEKLRHVETLGEHGKHVVLSFDGARRGNGDGAAARILWIRNMNGEFERISHGGKVLKDTTAMTAEREALSMGVEHLMSLFPVETNDFQFVVENESRETKYIVDTQSMRIFGLRNDHAEDVHRANANRRGKKSLEGAPKRRVLGEFGNSSVNKDWYFTRQIKCDHLLKFRPRDNSCSAGKGQMPPRLQPRIVLKKTPWQTQQDEELTA